MPDMYSDFFHKLTSYWPLPYQERHARNPFAAALLIVSTGLGKTHTVLIPWLFAKDHGLPSPTRLVFVLPRRNLTSQTAFTIRTCRDNAGLTHIPVLELMGGSGDNDRTLRPDSPAVIVATQDLFFSRALNRGYARRPPRWPIDFALYSQDCLIVLDEIQLMDDALATSAQLAALRSEFKTFGDCPCIWMSATAVRQWLQTVDFPVPPSITALDETDRQHPLVHKRLHAPKTLAPAPDDCRTPTGCAAFALQQHKPGTLTLIVANTVQRAREIYAAIRSQFENVLLLHSRFRPRDRKAIEARMQTKSPAGHIIVATQVLEAGIDISAYVLITDIAPWGSLVQRFGRVNRYGELPESLIWWVDQPTYSKQKDPWAPYSEVEIQRARERVTGLTSASPAILPPEDGPAPWRHVLRRADLLDLFDTSADLMGNDLDVSRFIRATEDKDAFLAWRQWDGDGAPPANFPDASDDELCPVAIGELREFLRKHSAYLWNFATEEWTEAVTEKLCPGTILVTRAREGGYTDTAGWYPESKAEVPPLPEADPAEADGDSSDPLTWRGYWQSLGDHTRRVCEELEVLLENISLPGEAQAALRTAARKHDWGKTHEVFRNTMKEGAPGQDFWAKRPGGRKHCRPHFRHELASALAMLNSGDSPLAAYLAAAHHGRTRMSLRAMPGEKEVDGRRIARGILDGDLLPPSELAGLSLPETALSLAVTEMGAEGGSWTQRILQLRDTWGPFRLAYLEMLLRAADEAASAQPNLEASECTK